MVKRRKSKRFFPKRIINAGSLTASYYIFSFIVVGIFILVGIATTAIIRNQVTKDLFDDYAREETFIAEQTAKSLKLEVEAAETKLRYIAQIPELQSLDPAVCNARIDAINSQTMGDMGRIARMDAQGNIYCAQNKMLIGSQRERPHVAQIINDPQHKTVIGRMVKPEGADSYILALHVPVFGSGGEFLGTLSVGLRQKSLAQKHLTNVKIGESGFVSLVDDNGDIIHGQTSQFIGRNRYEEELQQRSASISELNRAFELAAKEGKSSTFVATSANVQRFTTVTSTEVIPGRRWVVYSTIPTTDIYKSPISVGASSAPILLMAIYSLLLLVTIFILGAFLRRRMFKPLGQLAEIEEQARKGNTKLRAPHDSTDEVGALAQAFNAMLDRLSQHRADLQLQVEQKTRDLALKVKEVETDKLKDEALLNSIGEGLIVIDEEGKIASMNPAAEEMLGYDDKEVVGKWFPGAIKAYKEDGGEIEALERPIVKALSTGKVVTEIEVYERKDRTRFNVAVTVSPVVIDGRPIGAIKVFRDITKERQLEQAKEDFVSLASHQMRTPATGIKAAVSMILDGYLGEITPKQHEMLHKVFETNERQLQIVNDLLNVARLDAGKMELELDKVDIGQLIKDVVEEQRGIIGERKQTLEVNLSDPVIAEVDPSLIRMVVENLITNASKYTPDGGKIKVSLKGTKAGAEIKVEDNGVGIASSDLGRLFKRFSRIGNELSTVRGGSGLGLYLAHNLVLLHKGKVRVSSVVGKGTTFTVQIPLAHPKPSSVDVEK